MARAEHDRDLDLSVPRTVHIVGLGGSIMSAFAAVLIRMGHRVSGSDLRDSRTLERLRALGVDARVGHDAGNVPDGVDALIASTAVAPSNPEVRRAHELGVPVFSRADTQRAIVALRRTVAVAGSHGKTTTSSMLALILREAGWHPSFLIGGDLNEVGTNASWDDGDWLVVEADESDGTFLEFAPEAAIVTNVEADHLTHWGDFPALIAGFERFLDDTPGTRVVSADDVVAARLAGERRDEVVTFGFADDADYQIRDYVGKRNGSQFVLARRGEAGDVVEMPVPGRHNAKNAAAAAAMALEIGVPFEAVRAALGGFGGVARRFQFRGERDGVTFVDDYAHLPGEVAHMIDAAREGDWAHVIVVFQPHRYTRTAALWRDFADAFAGADTVVLTDIYGFNETPQPGVSGRLILPRGARRAPRAARGLPPATRRPRPARAEARAIRRRRADARRRRSHDRARRVVGARGMNAVDTGEAVAVELERALPGAVERDVPLASLTTYHLGGPVSTLVRARSLDALAAVARVVREHAPPLLLVGRGSNLLVADHGFTGVAVVLAGDFERVDLATEPRARCGPAARSRCPCSPRRTAAAGRSGLEFFVGIPGSVGGAVRMNAGGHGRETAEVLVRARTVDLAGSGDEVVREPLRPRLRLPPLGARRRRDRDRRRASPSSPRPPRRASARSPRSCAGAASTSPAGPTPDRCSGTRRATRRAGSSTPPASRASGSAARSCRRKHANFFQAEPGATADDVYRLMQEVRRRVGETSGITLEPELRLVGFGDTP